MTTKEHAPPKCGDRDDLGYIFAGRKPPKIGSTERKQGMSKNGAAGHAKLQIILPDPDEDDRLHSFSVDTKNEESVVKFLRSLLQIYGAPGKEMAAPMLDAKHWRGLSAATSSRRGT